MTTRRHLSLLLGALGLLDEGLAVGLALWTGVAQLVPGMDDGRSWGKVAARLAPRFRVVRLHRRQYRLDIATGSLCTIAQEVDDVLAVAKVIGEPMLVGSATPPGGVVALEAMVASPSTFPGAVIYEPPVAIGPPLGGEALQRVRAAMAAGKAGKAITIFMRDIVGIPPLVARQAGMFVAIKEDAMSYARQLLDTYPRSFNVDAGVLATTIDALSDCAQACGACADDCLSEQDVAELVKCIRLCLDCADVCTATLRVASRQTGYDANVMRPLLGACVAACRSCGDECQRHAGMHEHCRVCAEACRRCEQACDQLLAAIR